MVNNQQNKQSSEEVAKNENSKGTSLGWEILCVIVIAVMVGIAKFVIKRI